MQETEEYLKKTYSETQSLIKEQFIVGNNNMTVEQCAVNENLELNEHYEYVTESMPAKYCEEATSYCRIGKDRELDKDTNSNTSKFCKDLIEEEHVGKVVDNYDETIVGHLIEKNSITSSTGNVNPQYSNENEEKFNIEVQNEDKSYIGDEKNLCEYETVSEKIIGETDHEIITETLKYSCGECGDSFLIKIGFNQHMLQKHNVHLRDQDYSKYCSKVIVKQPKSFPELIKVPRSLASKTERQSQCRMCKKYFESDTELKEHMNVHKTHVCPVCGSAFLKKYYLTDHLVIHSSQRDYVCHICKASFKHRHGLTAHRNSHKTFRDHTCETCGLGFKDKGTLRVHIKLKHSDDRNFACSECPLTFKLKSFLDKHFIRKHTERTKDFVCSKCGVAYLNKTTLLRHISEKHSGKSPQHICAVCGKSFCVKLVLNKHLQSIHKISLIK